VRTPSQAAPRKLAQEIRAPQFFTLAFGAIIGVGWVVVVGEWLGQAGPLGVVLSFVAGGAVMMLVGLCYAEMATLLPVSGGEVAYAHEAFGVETSFAVGWLLTLAYISTTAFEAISVGWVLGALLPGIGFAGSDLAIGLGGMALLTVINYRGAKSAAAFQDVLTWGLIALSLVFISAGLVRGDAANLRPFFREGSAWSGALSVFMTTPFWFAGFNTIPQMMEEKAPGVPLKVVGRSLLLSIGSAALFYCLVVVACSMTMPWQGLLDFELPASGAFETGLHSPLLAKTVLVAALLGLVTTWNAVFLCASRVLFSLGRARLLPEAFGRIRDASGSPSVAVVFTGLVAAGLVLMGREALLHLVNVAATCLGFSFLLTSLAVIRLRASKPDADRPNAVPGGRATAVAAACGSLFMLVLSLYLPYHGAAGRLPVEWGLVLGWMVAGALLWLTGASIRESVTEDERRKLMLGA
jgi:amino acid transporter